MAVNPEEMDSDNYCDLVRSWVVPGEFVRHLTSDAAGAPALMQGACLKLITAHDAHTTEFDAGLDTSMTGGCRNDLACVYQLVDQHLARHDVDQPILDDLAVAV